jgi:hypothetical protein
MAHPGFAVDDEIRESLRVIQRQRNGKRVAVIGMMVAAFLALLIAVLFGYKDRGNMQVRPPESGTM